MREDTPTQKAFREFNEARRAFQDALVRSLGIYWLVEKLSALLERRRQ